jgi:hypothetical protein
LHFNNNTFKFYCWIFKNSTGAGTRLKLSDKNYYLGTSEIQSNVIYNKPSFEIIGVNSIVSKNDSSKFNLGYTFEIGILFLNFTKTFINILLQTNWENDTIGYKIIEDYKVGKIQFTNFIDISYKINDKFTLITSAGFKVENKDGHTKIENSRQQNYICQK